MNDDYTSDEQLLGRNYPCDDNCSVHFALMWTEGNSYFRAKWLLPSNPGNKARFNKRPDAYLRNRSTDGVRRSTFDARCVDG